MKLNQKTIEANQVTLIGLIVNICLFIFKFLAGWCGASHALIADSFHTLSDFATDIAVLIGVTLGSKPIDKSHDYGHGKIETMASNAVGIVLLLVGVFIGWDGLHDILDIIKGQRFSSPGWIAFWAALVSIMVKEVLYRYTVKSGHKLNSQAMIANAWHHRSDVLSAIGVMLSIMAAHDISSKVEEKMQEMFGPETFVSVHVEPSV